MNVKYKELNRNGKYIIISFIVSTVILILLILLEFVVIPLSVSNLSSMDWILFIIVFYINGTIVIITGILTCLIITIPEASERKERPKKIKRYQVKHYEVKSRAKRARPQRAKKSRKPRTTKKTGRPTNAEKLIYTANECKMSRDYESAIQLYQQALKLEPKSIQALTSLGVIYKNQGEYERSIEVSEQAVILDPKNKFAWNLLGLVYLNTKNYDKAIKAYEHALNIDISSKEAAHNLGFAYAKKGDFKNAIEIITAALDKTPKYSQVWYKLSKVYLNAHRTDDALAACKQSLKLNPDSKRAKNLLKIIQQSVGKDSSSTKSSVKHTDNGEWEIAGAEKYPKRAVEEYESLGKIAVRGNKFTNTFKKWYEQNHNR